MSSFSKFFRVVNLVHLKKTQFSCWNMWYSSRTTLKSIFSRSRCIEMELGWVEQRIWLPTVNRRVSVILSTEGMLWKGVWWKGCGEGRCGRHPLHPEVDTPWTQRQTSPLTPHHLDPEEDPSSGRYGHWGGRYASYWNAFLFL